MKVFTVWGGFADEPCEHFGTFRSREAAFEYCEGEKGGQPGLLLYLQEEEGDPTATYADDAEE